MHILHWNIIIKITILLILIILLIIWNIYIFVRKKRTFYTLGIHMVSASFLGYLYCLFMQTAIIQLELEEGFILMGNTFLTIMTILVFVNLIHFAYCEVARNKKLEIPPDILNLFSMIDDYILICDYQGTTYLVNRERDWKELIHKDSVKLDDLVELFSKQVTQEMYQEMKDGLTRQSFCFEFCFLEYGKYYLVKTSPIVVGKGEAIGVIVLLHDINCEKKLMLEIDQKNQNLEVLNKRLVSYVETAHVLEAEKARLNLLENIQTELLGEIEEIIKEIRITQEKDYDDVTGFHQDISGISVKLRKIYQIIRSTIQKIYILGGEENDKGNSGR